MGPRGILMTWVMVSAFAKRSLLVYASRIFLCTIHRLPGWRKKALTVELEPVIIVSLIEDHDFWAALSESEMFAMDRLLTFFWHSRSLVCK